MSTSVNISYAMVFARLACVMRGAKRFCYGLLLVERAAVSEA